MNKLLKIFLLSMNVLSAVVVNATISDANKRALFPVEVNDGKVVSVEQLVSPRGRIRDGSAASESGDEELNSWEETQAHIKASNSADDHVDSFMDTVRAEADALDRMRLEQQRRTNALQQCVQQLFPGVRFPGISS